MTLPILEAQPKCRTDFDFTVSLAPSFGKLRKWELAALDAELDTIIAATVTPLSHLPKKQQTWEKMAEVLAQSPMLESIRPGDEVMKSDTYSQRNSFWLAADGTPGEISRAHFRAWFTNLIGDNDVLNSTKVDISLCEWMACKTGSDIKSFWEILRKSESIDTTLVDIGVLRYPTRKNPYFKVYRITLRAWAYTSRIATIQNDYNGVECEYQCRKYRACSSTLSKLTEYAKKDTILRASALFNR